MTKWPLKTASDDGKVFHRFIAHAGDEVCLEEHGNQDLNALLGMWFTVLL